MSRNVGFYDGDRTFIDIWRWTTALACLGCLFAPAAWAGASGALPEAPQPVAAAQDRSDLTLRNFPRNIFEDQGPIWTGPLHIRKPQFMWLLPLAVATAASIATDSRASTEVVSHDPGFNNANTNASNALIGGFIALPAGLYGWGAYGHHEHAREAGLLGGEALVDGVIVEQGTKLIFFRERPAQDHGRGLFFQGSAGANSSFPSSHAVLAWSSAAVLAEEYRSPWARAGLYTFATGVSLTRVLGQQHFPTDALLGSTAGWLIGHYVAKRHSWSGGMGVARRACHVPVPGGRVAAIRRLSYNGT